MIFHCSRVASPLFLKIKARTLERREHILAAAYAHFSTKGYNKTTLSDIANSLKMSKKTIYFQFRNKEDLLLEVGKWKLDMIVNRSLEIIYSDRPFALKLINYLELVYENVRHINPMVLREAVDNTGKMSQLMGEYINETVFERFAVLMEQGREEQMIDDRVDPEVALVVYRQTLKSFLFEKPNNYPQVQLEKEFHVFLCKQLRSFFRGLLSKEGTIQFDELFDQRAHLVKAYA